MPDPLLIRDVMRIGVPTCRLEDPVRQVAAQMIENGWSAVVVMDDDNNAVGWLNERLVAVAYARHLHDLDAVTAGDVLDPEIPEAPADLPLSGVIQLMADMAVDHLFFLHHAGGRMWPASVLSLRDVVRAAAGPEHLQGQGVAASRPSPIDLFRQRYGLPPKK